MLTRRTQIFMTDPNWMYSYNGILYYMMEYYILLLLIIYTNIYIFIFICNINILIIILMEYYTIMKIGDV